MKFLEHDIADRNFLRYVKRFLIAGVMEGTEWKEGDKGTKEDFDFLGFTFFNTHTREDKYRLGVRTSKKKLIRAALEERYLELETDGGLNSRMRENRTYGSVRGVRQAFHFLNKRKECRDCLLD